MNDQYSPQQLQAVLQMLSQLRPQDASQQTQSSRFVPQQAQQTQYDPNQLQAMIQMLSQQQRGQQAYNPQQAQGAQYSPQQGFYNVPTGVAHSSSVQQQQQPASGTPIVDGLFSRYMNPQMGQQVQPRGVQGREQELLRAQAHNQRQQQQQIAGGSATELF